MAPPSRGSAEVAEVHFVFEATKAFDPLANRQVMKSEGSNLWVCSRVFHKELGWSQFFGLEMSCKFFEVNQTMVCSFLSAIECFETKTQDDTSSVSEIRDVSL